MRRVAAGLILVMFSGAFLVGPPAAAQTPAPPAAQTVLSQEYKNDCGFSIRHPSSWSSVPRSDQYFELKDDKDPPMVLWIGPIRDIQSTQPSIEALAAAMAGQYCLSCLRTSLVWIDRFSVGSMFVNYTISRGDLRSGARTIPGGYFLDFFVVEDGTMRGLGGSGWTWAELTLWVHRSQYANAFKSVILPMVQSLRLTRPQLQCW